MKYFCTKGYAAKMGRIAINICAARRVRSEIYESSLSSAWDMFAMVLMFFTTSKLRRYVCSG